MEKSVWKIYLLLLFCFLCPSLLYSQITITQFNASWNSSNDVEWLNKLSDVDKIKYIDIAENTKAQQKHEIVVVPTIVIFNNNEEVKRFQANIMMTMEATKSEVQNSIDEIVMEAF